MCVTVSVYLQVLQISEVVESIHINGLNQVIKNIPENEW